MKFEDIDKFFKFLGKNYRKAEKERFEYRSMFVLTQNLIIDFLRKIKLEKGQGHIKSISRGIGKDRSMPCFACGKYSDNNIACFVDSKEEGEEILKMFERGIWLDYRKREPNWIQVKINACDDHIENLRMLSGLINISKTIGKDYIEAAINLDASGLEWKL